MFITVILFSLDNVISQSLLLLSHSVSLFGIKEQFTFIHDAILESVTCGDTQIAATNLRAAIAKMRKKDPLNQKDAFQHQFTVSRHHSVTFSQT